MISGGAAFVFTLLALIAGITIGTLLPHHDNTPTDTPSDTTRVGPEWGEISRAAADAYQGAHAAALERRGLEVPSFLPRIVLTDRVGELKLGSAEEFWMLAGVDAETVLKALGHYPMIRWGDPIPERFTLA